MATVRPLKPSPEVPPPTLSDRAIDNLRYIRETMERAGSFTAISGWGMTAVGAIALLASVVSLARPTPGWWLGTWLTTAACCTVLSMATMIAKARRTGTSLVSGPARKLGLAFAPSVVAGLVLTAALVRDEQYALLPGVWLLVYGAGVVAAGAFSTRVIPVLGAACIGAGALALFVPQPYGTWSMALAFGVLHMACGVQIARRHGG
jgi:hypothetical protein